MTSVLLSGLAALIMGSIGALASTADAFSSVVTRRMYATPRTFLVQDAGPSGGGAPSAPAPAPAPSAGGGGEGGGPAMPPSIGGGGSGAGGRGPEGGMGSPGDQSGGSGGERRGPEGGQRGPDGMPPRPEGERRGSEGQKFQPGDRVAPRFAPGTEGQAGQGVQMPGGPSEKRMPPRSEGPEGGERGPGMMPRGSENGSRGPEGEKRGPGQEGMMRGGPEGQTGPSDEERQAQDEERQAKEEARQKEMEAKQLAQMKRGMKRAAAELAKMKRQFDKYASKGLTISADCSDALAKAQGVVDAVMNAESFEAVQDIEMQDLGDSFDTVNECRQNLDRLSRLPQMLKRVDSQIKQMERNWTRAKKGAPEGAADAIAEGDKVMADIQAARLKLEEQIKSGEIDDFEATLEDEIFGRFDDLGAAMQQIEAAKNAKRFVAQFTRNIKDAEHMIAKLKKMGKDTSKLEELLSRAKALYAQIKGFKAGSDEWLQAVEDLANLGQDFAEATGGTEDVGGMIGPPSGGGPQLRLEGIPSTDRSGGGGGPGQMAP